MKHCCTALLDSIITSKTRVKLLLKFFLNPGTMSYLRGLAEEFGESTNSVRVELNRMSKAGLLESESQGRTKVYRANNGHPLFPEIHNIVRKYLGIDVVEAAIDRLGNGENVTKIAFDLGYESLSAFIEMFRRSLGTSPGQYLK